MNWKESGLLHQFSREWGLVSFRGVAAIIFGVMVFLWPDVNSIALVALWSAYALADGILALVAAVRIRDWQRPIMPLVAIAVLGIAAGLATLANPEISPLSLLISIGSWGLLTGILQILTAIRLRKEIKSEWLLVFSGEISVAFGLTLIVTLGLKTFPVAWLIGGYGIVFGAILTLLGFRLKGLARERIIYVRHRARLRERRELLRQPLAPKTSVSSPELDF
jgi:uncharacterized membrane protein HdeD (DUF308 family)